MQQEKNMGMVGGAGRPERLAWYRDLVEELTGSAPVLGQTTVPVLIEGMYWQVPQVVASVPAFASAAGVAYDAVRGRGETEEEALRVLCEQVHALTWQEQQMISACTPEPAYWLVAGVA